MLFLRLRSPICWCFSKPGPNQAQGPSLLSRPTNSRQGQKVRGCSGPSLGFCVSLSFNHPFRQGTRPIPFAVEPIPVSLFWGGVTPEARQKRAGKKTIIVRGRTCPTLPVALRVLRAARGHTLLSWQFDRRRPCETSIIRSLVPPPPSSPRVVGRYEAWAGTGTTDHSKTREEVTGAWVVDTLLAISILAAPGNLFSRIFLIFPQTDLPTMLIGLPPVWMCHGCQNAENERTYLVPQHAVIGCLVVIRHSSR
jgi:hypothetical protein